MQNKVVSRFALLTAGFKVTWQWYGNGKSIIIHNVREKMSSLEAFGWMDDKPALSLFPIDECLPLNLEVEYNYCPEGHLQLYGWL